MLALTVPRPSPALYTPHPGILVLIPLPVNGFPNKLAAMFLIEY